MLKKYQKVIDDKVKKHGKCNTIFIREILNNKAAILFQNAFSTLEKYIDHVHTLNNAPARVSDVLKNEILDNFNELMKLKSKGINLFFTDIDKIKLMMEQELNEIKK